jgi:hypothetical protein
MNIGMKFLNKILETEFNNTLKENIYLDQVVFILEIQEWIKIYKPINNTACK